MSATYENISLTFQRFDEWGEPIKEPVEALDKFRHDVENRLYSLLSYEAKDNKVLSVEVRVSRMLGERDDPPVPDSVVEAAPVDEEVPLDTAYGHD